MPASDSIPEHQHQLTRRRLLATGVGAATAFGLPRFAPAASAASANAGARSYAATGAAVASVDLSGSWSFTPAGQGTTSIMVPGGGWYKQGFTNVGEAVYSRSITVPDSGQPQSVWIEFGVVNHQATLSVDGRVVGTQTTAFTPSKFDITAYVTPGSTHTISVDVKGRNALKTSSGNYLVPVAADWCEAVPQGIFRSAFLRVYPAVYVSDAFVRTSVANQSLTYDVSVTNTSGSSRSVTLTGSLASDNGTSFSYPMLPSATVAVAAHSTAKVTVGPVAWNLGTTSYWWPNVPYRSGYRAQLHDLSVHASTDDGHTSDATYRFRFREFTQNGAYYYLNGVRANLRGDNLQGADYDRVNNGGDRLTMTRSPNAIRTFSLPSESIPHNASDCDEPRIAALTALARSPKVVAIGETGLDFHYMHSPTDAQEQSLGAHLELAGALNRPVMIHCRDAERRLCEIVRETGMPPAGGMLWRIPAVSCPRRARPAGTSARSRGARSPSPARRAARRAPAACAPPCSERNRRLCAQTRAVVAQRA